MASKARRKDISKDAKRRKYIEKKGMLVLNDAERSRIKVKVKDDEDGATYISLNNMEVISHFHAEILVES